MVIGKGYIGSGVGTNTETQKSTMNSQQLLLLLLLRQQHCFRPCHPLFTPPPMLLQLPSPKFPPWFAASSSSRRNKNKMHEKL